MPLKDKSTKDYFDISKRFKQIRIDNKLTQRELGEIVGLSAPAIGAIENGLYTPNFSVLRILKKKFNIEYSFIIDGTKEGDIKSLRQENQKLKAEVARLTKVVDKLVKS